MERTAQQQYSLTGKLHPSRSYFDLSHEHVTTCYFGQLIPVHWEECMPADHIKFAIHSLIKLQPMRAPIMHEVNVYFHSFFVPYRILWDDWEDFITGGQDGEYLPNGAFALTEPKWIPTEYLGAGSENYYLWDYLGFPMRRNHPSYPGISIPIVPPNPVGAEEVRLVPNDYLRRAYNMIYNEYYRDNNIQKLKVDESNELILHRNWEKDYFTASLPFQLRGTEPALPLSGYASAVFEAYGANEQLPLIGRNAWFSGSEVASVAGNPHPPSFILPGTLTQTMERGTTLGTSSRDLSTLGRNLSPFPSLNDTFTTSGVYAHNNIISLLNRNTIDLSNLITINVAQIREIFQIQKWMERNARGGVRYKEFLEVHYGTSPSDARLQRPEYIGGSRQPVIISEILQTSETTSNHVQGTRTGHANSYGDGFIGSYAVKEFGVIMTLMSVMPRPSYNSQGIDRQMIKVTQFDYPFPEFSTLSEVAIYNGELYLTSLDPNYNQDVFGYQGIYDEYRTRKSRTSGMMRDIFKYWHLARDFNAPVSLNPSFIECRVDPRIFLVQDEPPILASMYIDCDSWRPLPIIAEPGLIDHH